LGELAQFRAIYTQLIF